MLSWRGRPSHGRKGRKWPRPTFDTIGCATGYLPSQSAACASPVSERRARAFWGRVPSGCRWGRIAMPVSRPMPVVSAELRLKAADDIFRVFYYLASPKVVLVFHAFVKKTQRTPPLEIELARKRLKELLDA